jgi:hypothetical protein
MENNIRVIQNIFMNICKNMKRIDMTAFGVSQATGIIRE